jgi:hypothetical protein
VIFRPSVVFAKDRQPCIFFLLHVGLSNAATAQYSSAAVDGARLAQYIP